MTILVRPIDFQDDAEREAFRALRHDVLRPGKPREMSVYAGDDDPQSQHLSAWKGDTLVGVATFLPVEGALRLRGMAVAPSVRGQGVGARIIRYAQERARETHTPMWCYARESAIGFYEKLGWTVEGDLFDVPDVGAHKVMRWTP